MQALPKNLNHWQKLQRSLQRMLPGKQIRPWPQLAMPALLPSHAQPPGTGKQGLGSSAAIAQVRPGQWRRYYCNYPCVLATLLQESS